jgi:signal transduction histidine kinase/CheY-like chemotaxis protein
VLIVDDEETVRLVCERSLTRAGYQPSVFASGREAIAAARRESFDVLVLDVRMPDLDGPRVLAELRGLDPDAPCLVISGYADFDAAVELLRQGANDFLRKPFDVNDLVAAVDRILASTHLKVDSALLAATQTIFSSLDAEAIIKRVLGVMRSLLHATPAVLVAEGPPASRRARVHRLDGEDRVVTTPANVAPALLARLLELRDPVLLDGDSHVDAELVQALAPGAGSIIVQPLSVGDRAVGLLAAARAPRERSFGDGDLRRTTLVAGHVALALENGRLHAATEAQARQLERALDRLVVAERIATVSRLASGLGHEIANPTAAVQAHLEIARELIDAGRPAEARDALERAGAGARGILDICQSLRPLSHAGQRVTHLDLRQVIDGALLLVSYELRGRARVTVEPPARDPLLSGDPARLGQVFLNLLLNAAQAIPPGAPSDNEVHISFARRGDEHVVRIRDSGVGVPPHMVEKIFEPTITTKATGHGMGLAICRWILEEAGGAIACLPQPRGTVFEVRLPARPPATSPGTPAAPG